MSPTLIPPLSRGGRPLPTKVVVRLLPGALTEQEFRELLPPDTLLHTDYVEYVQGTYLAHPTPDNPNVNSRCYLNFKSFSLACEFITRMHGKSFESFRAVAAFAPFQRVPRHGKQLKNGLENTIEQEPHYLAFVRSLEEPARLHTSTTTALATSMAPLVKEMLELELRETERRRKVEESKRVAKEAASKKQGRGHGTKKDKPSTTAEQHNVKKNEKVPEIVAEKMPRAPKILSKPPPVAN